jgi:predicted SPOUT superfamily RNA methylase MTH1
MTRTALVPSSLVREAEDKREATRKLGYVARAATVFRIDRLVVFPDSEGERRWGAGFVETVLRYAATPPYLRKEAWDVRDELECAGVLPPLRVSPRTGSGSKRPGSLRQGIVTDVGPDGRVRVTCGLQHPVSLLVPSELTVEEGERVAIRVSSREPVRARIVDEPLPGPSVRRMDLPEALSAPDAGLRIATSRHGTDLTVGRLADLPGPECDLTVAFGAPGRGLPAILDLPLAAVGADGADATDDPGAGFDRWLNTVPDQGSEVVRTEEAMFASLAPLTLPRTQE